jgi:hypothetical protein
MPGFDHSASTAPCGHVTSDVASSESPGVQGNTVARPSVGQTLSAKIWGFDLCKDLPRVLSSNGVEALRGDPARARAFLIREFPTLTEEALGAEPSETVQDAKRWYLRTACDVIELQHAGETVGVFIGAPEDWSSYYVRIFALLPRYQRPALIRRFARECMFEPLRAARIERVIADTSPANIAMARCFSEQNFYFSGHQLSERWGPLVRYTHFLDPACEAAFLKRFAGTAPPGTRPRKEDTP